jgi:hypothetical protein
MEIRVYYESLEQGFDYLLPIVAPFGDDVKLVKKIQKECSHLSGVMKALHSMVAPDALVTAVVGEHEIPLVIIEFTEAVKAEDHELQRSYGAIAGFWGNLYYVKISGHKESTGVFGAAEYNPYTTPKMLHEEYGYEGFVIAEWETLPDNPQKLQHSQNLFSCPPKIPILDDTIKSAIEAVKENPNDWLSRALPQLKKKESFRQFAARRDESPTMEDLLAVWQKRKKQRYFVTEEYAGCKINRFGHAMDPDRGILMLISTLLSRTHKIYGEYAVVRPRHKTLNTTIETLDQLKEQFPKVIKFDLMPKWFQKMMNDIVSDLASHDEVRDIHADLQNHAGERWGTVVRTLTYFCDGIFLGKGGPLLTWRREEFLGGELDSKFHETARRFLGFDQPSPPTPLAEVTNIVDEDEVTYILAHRILIPSGFEIVSISYPGAQGGTAVLPDVGEGKRQRRIYVDLIACSPDESRRVLLNESKGMFEKRAIQEDVEKLARFKTSDKHKSAMNVALTRAKVIQEDGEVREVVIGISFGILQGMDTTWRPDEVDFILRVVDREKWAIGIFDQRLSEQIKTIAGQTNFPRVYEFVAAAP